MKIFTVLTDKEVTSVAGGVDCHCYCLGSKKVLIRTMEKSNHIVQLQLTEDYIGIKALDKCEPDCIGLGYIKGNCRDSYSNSIDRINRSLGSCRESESHSLPFSGSEGD